MCVIKPVIVTDVRYRMGLPIIRALGRKDIYVIAAERRGCPPEKALGFFSKYTKEKIFLSDAEVDETAFIDDLRESCSKLNARPTVIPVGIATLLAMCRHRETVLEFADVALPPLSSIELANDKARLIPFAESIGVPVPETLLLKKGDVLEKVLENIPVPAVAKLPRGEMLGLAPDERYKIAGTKDELIAFCKRFLELDEIVLVQEYITGDGYGVSAVFDKNSEPLEIFCHHRIREYPASGGPSCFCESADLPELAAHAVKLLKSLNWCGVAMVEFKGSPDTGFYLMEINPRFWGSSALAPNSGCDISQALCHAARGKMATPFSHFEPKYKVGHKMRFLLQDLLSFPAYFKRSKRKLSFALTFFLGILNPKISDGVLDLRDIRSSFAYLRQALKKTDSIVR